MLNNVKSHTSDIKEHSNKENFNSNGKQLPNLIVLNSPPNKEVQPFILITPESNLNSFMLDPKFCSNSKNGSISFGKENFLSLDSNIQELQQLVRENFHSNANNKKNIEITKTKVYFFHNFLKE